MLEKFYRVFNCFMIIFITTLTIGSVFIQDYKRKNNEDSKNVVNIIENKDVDKLKNIGYSNEEIKIVKNNKDLVKIILKKNYDKNIIVLASTKDFNYKKLDAYLNYHNDNPNVSFTSVIEHINSKEQKSK